MQRPSCAAAGVAVCAAVCLALLVCAATVDAKVQAVVLEKPDSCPRTARKGDHLELYYSVEIEETGQLLDDNFDFRYPQKIELGKFTTVPKGLHVGLTGMCEGEKRKITVPPKLAYGVRGEGQVPGNVHLVYIARLDTIIRHGDEL
ncbi:FK506-binding protein 2 [Porphyridium purpureum]|uniref:peptidylprolyl isomerase n=1 Tax=Porphyridium purpureum TaxID=35688 RepID=A0A5J4YU13_PORPP|nr:FK506-binding protein 2 [Porphyridium purpureum]|eukprot:POR8573..scf227_4